MNAELVVLSCLWASANLVACGGRVATDAPNVQGQAPELSVEEFIPRLQDAICSSADRCCEQSGWTHSKDCPQAVRSHWQPVVNHAVSIGATFNANVALACVKRLETEWASCSNIKVASSTTDAVCAETFTQTRSGHSPGESCETAADCRQDEASPVICMKIGEGANVTGRCLRNRLSQLGGRCGGATALEYANCEAPYVCDLDLRCRTRFDLPNACNTLGGDTCAPGAVCDLDGGAVCKPAIPVGAPCGSHTDCENFACLGGLCRPYPDLTLSWYCHERLPSP